MAPEDSLEALMLTFALTAAALLAGNPCTLVTKAEAATVTGKVPTRDLPYGPEADPETKASVETFSTPAAALATMTPKRLLELMDPEAKVEPESGLGDRAFWAHSDTSARMVVIRGATAVSFVIGGVDLTKAGGKRAATRALAVKALSRL
jgi:hypothetical protein